MIAALTVVAGSDDDAPQAHAISRPGVLLGSILLTRQAGDGIVFTSEDTVFMCGQWVGCGGATEHVLAASLCEGQPDLAGSIGTRHDLAASSGRRKGLAAPAGARPDLAASFMRKSKQADIESEDRRERDTRQSATLKNLQPGEVEGGNSASASDSASETLCNGQSLKGPGRSLKGPVLPARERAPSTGQLAQSARRSVQTNWLDDDVSEPVRQVSDTDRQTWPRRERAAAASGKGNLTEANHANHAQHAQHAQQTWPRVGRATAASAKGDLNEADHAQRAQQTLLAALFASAKMSSRPQSASAACQTVCHSTCQTSPTELAGNTPAESPAARSSHGNTPHMLASISHLPAVTAASTGAPVGLDASRTRGSFAASGQLPLMDTPHSFRGTDANGSTLRSADALNGTSQRETGGGTRSAASMADLSQHISDLTQYVSDFTQSMTSIAHSANRPSGNTSLAHTLPAGTGQAGTGQAVRQTVRRASFPAPVKNTAAAATQRQLLPRHSILTNSTAHKNSAKRQTYDDQTDDYVMTVWTSDAREAGTSATPLIHLEVRTILSLSDQRNRTCTCF